MEAKTQLNDRCIYSYIFEYAHVYSIAPICKRRAAGTTVVCCVSVYLLPYVYVCCHTYTYIAVWAAGTTAVCCVSAYSYIRIRMAAGRQTAYA
jgi:hypothetical protein